jgi:hypothetical protein
MNKTLSCLIVLLFSPVMIALLGQGTTIPPHSKVYIAPADGFELFVAAALSKKKTPVLVVADRDSADFEIASVSDSGDRPGTARRFLTGQTGTDETASFSVTNLQTNVIAFAYNVDKKSSHRGKQSTAESFAKHLKKKIENDAKRR